MEKLSKLIQTLTKTELLLLKAYYKNLEKQIETVRRLELLNVLLKGKVTTDSEVCQLLYETDNCQAYQKLKTRFTRDLYKFLSLSDTVSEDTKMDVNEAKKECYKLLLVGHTLTSRLAFELAIRVFKEALVIAKRYELTYEAIGCLQMIGILDINNANSRLRQYVHFSTQQKEKIILLQQELLASDYYNEVTLPNVDQKNKEYLYAEKATKNVALIQELSKQTKSPTIYHWEYRIGVNAALMNQDFEKALCYAEQLNKLLNTNQAVSTKNSLGLSFVLLAICYLELDNHARAQQFAQKALKMPYAFYNASIVLFASYIAQNDVLNAKAILQKVQSKIANSNDQKQKAKWKYYEAIMLFADKKFASALKILSQNSDLAKDKTGWLMGFKLMEVLCHIELDNLEVAALKLRSFKLFFERNPSANLQRYKTVQIILKDLLHTKLDYQLITKKHEILLKLLTTAKGEYYRDPLAFELITIEGWLINKV